MDNPVHTDQSFIPPEGWQMCARLYAPIQISPAEITNPMRENLCYGEWSETGFYLGTVEDTVNMYYHWQDLGFHITEYLYERLREQMRIAMAVGKEDRKGEFEKQVRL